MSAAIYLIQDLPVRGTVIDLDQFLDCHSAFLLSLGLPKKLMIPLPPRSPLLACGRVVTGRIVCHGTVIVIAQPC
jgi:hypothetical protein